MGKERNPFSAGCRVRRKNGIDRGRVWRLTGYAVIIKLLQRIYGGHGYYIHWTYEVALLFAKRLGVGGSVVSEIIEAAVKRGMFHKEIFAKYKVLTSKGIQNGTCSHSPAQKKLKWMMTYFWFKSAILQKCKHYPQKCKQNC